MANKNENRNQHYTLKCYLKNFSDGEKYIAAFFIQETDLLWRQVWIVWLLRNICTVKI